MMQRKNKAAVGFIFITLLVDVIGFGIIIPVMPGMISNLKQVSINEAARYGSFLTIAYAMMQFVFAPILGNLSDKYGRRPVLLASLFGFGLDYILLALAPTYGWLFAGRIIAGITGSSFTTAAAYISDVSTAETRTKNFGMIGAAFGIGFIAGPSFGGFLAQWGERVPFIASAILVLLNWLYGYLILPESLAPENRREFSWKRANPVGSILNLTKHKSIAGLLIAIFFIYIAAHALMSNWNYFTIYVFNWPEWKVGLSLGLVGLLVGLVQAGLTRVINPRIGNEKSIYYGLVLYAVGMLLFGLATQSWMMFAILFIYCLGGFAQPAIQAVMSGRVPSNAQGELQGALTACMSLSAIIGPYVMNNLFFYFTRKTAPIHLPGAPFLLASLLMAISAVVAYLTLHSKKEIKAL